MTPFRHDGAVVSRLDHICGQRTLRIFITNSQQSYQRLLDMQVLPTAAVVLLVLPWVKIGIELQLPSTLPSTVHYSSHPKGTGA